MSHSEQINLGVFQLGLSNVEVYALPNWNGGEFYFCPDSKRLPCVKIGLACSEWGNVVDTLLHESAEYLLAAQQLRFEPSAKFNGDHANYLFVFDHTQFADMCARQAVFIAAVLPVLAKQWECRKVNNECSQA